MSSEEEWWRINSQSACRAVFSSGSGCAQRFCGFWTFFCSGRLEPLDQMLSDLQLYRLQTTFVSVSLDGFWRHIDWKINTVINPSFLPDFRRQTCAASLRHDWNTINGMMIWHLWWQKTDEKWQILLWPGMLLTLVPVFLNHSHTYCIYSVEYINHKITSSCSVCYLGVRRAV